MAGALATNWICVEELEANVVALRELILVGLTQVVRCEEWAVCGGWALMDPPCSPSHMLWMWLCVWVRLFALKLRLIHNLQKIEGFCFCLLCVHISV